MTLTALAPRTETDVSPAIVVAGFSRPQADELAAGLDAPIVVAGDAGGVLEELARREVAVVCLGPGLAGAPARDLLAEVAERHPERRGADIVLAAGSELELFQDLVNDDRLFYLTQKPPPANDAARILESALGHYRDRHGAPADEDDDRTLVTHRVLRLTESLARESTLEGALAETAEAVRELLEAERVNVFVYDPASETLWNRVPGEREERRESAAAGIISFVVRTRSTVCLDAVGADPRYDPEADNDEGPPGERFLAAPVVDAGGRRVWAVVVALRAPGAAPWNAADARSLEIFAEQAAPLLGRLTLQAELEKRTAERHGVASREAAQIFRSEALDHHLRGLEDQGHVLEIQPGWTRWVSRVLILAFAAALLFSVLGRVHEYAAGPAVVRLAGRTDITASLAGTVVALEVEAGQRVEEGQLLARFYGAAEAAELDRIRREFELGLANRLRNPADVGAAQALGTLQAQVRLAESRLEQRSLRAPHAGVVSDVWVQPGQHLAPGEVVLSLEGGPRELGIVALIPGRYRPLLEPGMPLRLELEGHRYVYQHLVVESVGEGVVGPAEARRALGPGLGDAIRVDGPVVFVDARLPAETFESGGKVYTYHDGIPGIAEVRVRSESILLTLVPGLKALLPEGD